MSYQALARKWRPKNFSELVGQPHIVNALSHQLSTDTLHHAYLFTGTRGVGKTTIARLLAKSLNCMTNGVSANPCGKCENCLDLDAGKFIDLIEVDAASRTGVDDTRELIESVSYLPAKGTHKVYLIDEVHMFSKSSFNALLKTLEEPPAHVKFVLATTDPEKLPITILSRCLQFNLKRYSEQAVFGHLKHICTAEGIEFDPIALQSLAKAGGGSMRDTLSLTDQALAFGQGKLRVAEVTMLLGTVHPSDIDQILLAVITRDGERLFSALQKMTEFEVDCEQLLTEVLTRIRALSWKSQGVEKGAQSQVMAAISVVSPSHQATLLQLWYDIGQKALQMMSKNHDPFGLLEMTLLRMLAFTPKEAIDQEAKQALDLSVPEALPAIEPNLDEKSSSAEHVDVHSAEHQSSDVIEQSATVIDNVPHREDVDVEVSKDDIPLVKGVSANTVIVEALDPPVTGSANPIESPQENDSGSSLAQIEEEFVKNNDISLADAPPLTGDLSLEAQVTPPTQLTSDMPEWVALVKSLDLTAFDSAIVESGELEWTSLKTAIFHYPRQFEQNAEAVKTSLHGAIQATLGREVDLVFESVEAEVMDNAPSQLEKQALNARREEIETAFFAQPVVRDIMDNLNAKVASDQITILEKKDS